VKGVATLSDAQRANPRDIRRACVCVPVRQPLLVALPLLTALLLPSSGQAEDLALGSPDAPIPADAAAGGKDQPSDLETWDLELINRFRADPGGEAVRLQREAFARYLFLGIDQLLFLHEMAQLRPAQPLVFDVRLLRCARAHCQYVIENQMTHAEDPDRPHFTGRTLADRAAAAGYGVHGEWAENIIRDAWDVGYGQAAFLVDHGAPTDPGGMQPERGHRRNLSLGALRAVGIGIIAHDGRVAIVQDMGSGGPRCIGGVVFSDADGSGRYAPGSGLGGIVITASDGSRTTTWASGAFTLPVHASAVTLSATCLGAHLHVALPWSSDNQHWNWAIAPPALWAPVDDLLAQAAGVADHASPPYFRIQVALAEEVRGLAPDPDRAARVAAVVGDVAAQLTQARSTVRAALAARDPSRAALIAAQAQPYAGTQAAGWFTQADAVAQADAEAVAMAAQLTHDDPPPQRERQRLRQHLTQLVPTVSEPEWSTRLQADLEQLQQRQAEP